MAARRAESSPPDAVTRGGGRVALDELADDAEAFERAGAVRCMHELQESASG
jgi:hypothetical protein